jgi:divalent metal cation (Fe/Co/Zn/Cd) transporter
VEAELKREIKEAVTRHPRIAGISNLVTERDGSWLKISFKINLTDGQTVEQEVKF